jgi:hypothetical protein
MTTVATPIRSCLSTQQGLIGPGGEPKGSRPIRRARVSTARCSNGGVELRTLPSTSKRQQYRTVRHASVSTQQPCQGTRRVNEIAPTLGGFRRGAVASQDAMSTAAVVANTGGVPGFIHAVILACGLQCHGRRARSVPAQQVTGACASVPSTGVGARPARAAPPPDVDNDPTGCGLGPLRTTPSRPRRVLMHPNARADHPAVSARRRSCPAQRSRKGQGPAGAAGFPSALVRCPLH